MLYDVDVCSPVYPVLQQFVLFCDWFACFMSTGIFQQHFKSTFLLSHRMFSLLLGRTCKQLKIVLLYNRKCRNEYFYRSYLQEMSFNSRAVFSEPEILASLAKIGILSFWIYLLYTAALAKSLASPVLQNSDICVHSLWFWHQHCTLVFAAWGWSNKEESRWEHSSRFGERRRHRYPGLTARRCCFARCCQERVPGSSAEAVYSRKYQLQRHPGKKFNTTTSCRWAT